MFVLGLQGSPRKKGNTVYLLNLFMKEAEKLGAKTHIVNVDEKNILPCKEYITCEKKGFCPIKDDMKSEIYNLLRDADVIVPATPIFFYNTTAQLKLLIDRSQTFWARKYKLGLTDAKRAFRLGYFLAVGATKGKNLFEGLDLTAKYFFDAVGAEYKGLLGYRKVEHPGDMEKHETVHADVEKLVKDLLTPLAERKTIMFICRENACRSQMAGAFARMTAGDKFNVITGGSTPLKKVNKDMVAVMAEKKIDVDFIDPKHINDALDSGGKPPSVIVTMGCKDDCPHVPGARTIDWNLEDPEGKPLEFMRQTRDDIENRVKDLILELT